MGPQRRMHYFHDASRIACACRSRFLRVADIPACRIEERELEAGGLN
jgi:hypothetical protein